MLVSFGLGNPIQALTVMRFADTFEIEIIDTEIEVEAEPVEFHVIALPDNYDSWVDPPVLGDVTADETTTTLEVLT